MNLKMWNKWKDFRLDEDLNEDGHTDVPSAIRKIRTSIEDCNQILQQLQSMSDEQSLPSWWSDKITICADYLNKARDFILNPKESVSVNEAREMDSKAIKYMRQLTDRNNHTMARYQLALQMKNKKLMKLYSSIIDIQDAYGSLPNDVSRFRHSLEKELFVQAKKMYSNYDEINKAF